MHCDSGKSQDLVWSNCLTVPGNSLTDLCQPSKSAKHQSHSALLARAISLYVLKSTGLLFPQLFRRMYSFCMGDTTDMSVAGVMCEMLLLVSDFHSSLDRMCCLPVQSWLVCFVHRLLMPLDSISSATAAGDVLNVSFVSGQPDLLLQVRTR